MRGRVSLARRGGLSSVGVGCFWCSAAVSVGVEPGDSGDEHAGVAGLVVESQAAGTGVSGQAGGGGEQP